MQAFVTYKDIKNIDLFEHFSKRYNVKKRVVETLVLMCDQWGAPRTHEVLQITKPLTYRQVRYIHRCIKLHKDLLFILKPGGHICEANIVERLKDRDWHDLYTETESIKKIKGTYRQLVFRKA